MKQQILSTLANSQSYTMAVADAMPDSNYNFKPVGGGWNFRELMHHIAYGIDWWMDNHIKGNKVEWDQPDTPANKKEITKNLEKSFGSLIATIEKQKLSDEAVQGFHATMDHITHHRGQAVVYLRCNGINPPEYTY